MSRYDKAAAEVLRVLAERKGISGFQATMEVETILDGGADNSLLARELGITHAGLSKARTEGRLVPWLLGAATHGRISDA